MSQPNADPPASAAPTVSPNVPSDVAEMSPNVSGCPPMSPISRRRKTNPNAAQVALTPIQLAAARMFAKGGRTLAIAQALNLNRRTLARWQQLAAFREEIVRVHRALSQPPPRPAPSQDLQPTERQFLNHVYTAAMKQFMKF